MQAEFWYNCWENNRIAFHSHLVNPHLQRYWQTLNLKAGSRILVPLCGKSNDMLWLLAQGYQVVGAELSLKAVTAFFADNNLQPIIRELPGFTVFETEDIQLFCGNFLT